jgi:hypothetical protein
MKRHVGELTTQAGLANALNLTDRRIRQLVDLGVVVREPDGNYDLDLNRRRYRLYIDRDVDRIADDIENASIEVDEALKLLHDEPDLSKRRALGREVGFVVGQLDRAMRLANALAPEHDKPLLETYTRMVVGRAAGAWMDLCRIILADDKEELAEPLLAATDDRRT